jgi:preprotein translocase subunit SecG
MKMLILMFALLLLVMIAVVVVTMQLLLRKGPGRAAGSPTGSDAHGDGGDARETE